MNGFSLPINSSVIGLPATLKYDLFGKRVASDVINSGDAHIGSNCVPHANFFPSSGVFVDTDSVGYVKMEVRQLRD